MYSLRRFAWRAAFSTTYSVTPKSRSISVVSRSALRAPHRTAALPFQRRWASDEAIKEQEQEQAAELEAEAEAQIPIEAAGETSSSALPDEVQSVSEAVNSSSASSAPDYQPKVTLYVGNLFFDVSEKDLHTEFERFGLVQKTTIIRDARGLSKGFGYITFESEDAARAAKDALDQSIFEGRRIAVQFSQRTPPQRPQLALNPPSKTLFIGNMSFEMTDRDLNELFKGIRNIIDVRVAIDRRTGQPRGFAHADFIDVKSAVAARPILLERETYGRKLRIDFSQSRMPRNQHSPRGREGGDELAEAAAASDRQ